MSERPLTSPHLIKILWPLFGRNNGSHCRKKNFVVLQGCFNEASILFLCDIVFFLLIVRLLTPSPARFSLPFLEEKMKNYISLNVYKFLLTLFFAGQNGNENI